MRPVGQRKKHKCLHIVYQVYPFIFDHSTPRATRVAGVQETIPAVEVTPWMAHSGPHEEDKLQFGVTGRSQSDTRVASSPHLHLFGQWDKAGESSCRHRENLQTQKRPRMGPMTLYCCEAAALTTAPPCFSMPTPFFCFVTHFLLSVLNLDCSHLCTNSPCLLLYSLELFPVVVCCWHFILVNFQVCSSMSFLLIGSYCGCLLDLPCL